MHFLSYYETIKCCDIIGHVCGWSPAKTLNFTRIYMTQPIPRKKGTQNQNPRIQVYSMANFHPETSLFSARMTFTGLVQNQTVFLWVFLVFPFIPVTYCLVISHNHGKDADFQIVYLWNIPIVTIATVCKIIKGFSEIRLYLKPLADVKWHAGLLQGSCCLAC